LGVPMDETLEALPIGKGELLREGEDLVLIGIGQTVATAMEAAERLDQVGIRAAVINARFVKPLDHELILEWARKTDRVITVEENVLQGGFGSAVLELFQESGFLPDALLRLGIPDVFVPHGGQATLRNLYGIDAEGIERAALALLNTHHGQHLRAIGQAAC